MSQITNDPVGVEELPHPSFIPSADTIKRTPPPPTVTGETPGFGDVFTAAKGDTFTVLAAQQALRANFEPDPNFELTTKMIEDRSKDEYGNDLPNELIPLYAGATSLGQLDQMYAQNLNRMNRMRILSEAGGPTRIAASILAEFTDPIGLAAGLVSGGGSVALNITRAGRLAQAAKAGFIGAGVFGGLEGYRATQVPGEGVKDVLSAAASGGLFNVGVHLSAGSGALTRALAGGSGMAVPTVAFGTLSGDQDAKDIAIGAGTAFLTGAFGGAMSNHTKESLKPVMWRLMKDVEASEIPPELATPKARAYYAEQYHAETVNQRTADALHAIAPDATEQQAAIDRVASQLAAIESATRSKGSFTVSDVMAATGMDDASAQAFVDRLIDSGGAKITTIDPANPPTGLSVVYNNETGKVGMPMPTEVSKEIQSHLNAVDAEYFRFHEKRAAEGNPESAAIVARLAQKNLGDKGVQFLDVYSVNDNSGKSISVGAATQAEIALNSPYGDRYDIALKNEDFHGARQATDARRTGIHIADMGSMVGRSEIPTIVRVGAMIFDDHLPKADGSHFLAGGAFVDSRQRAILAPYQRIVRKAYSDMREAGFTGKEADIDRMAYLAVTNGIPSDTPAPIARLAQETAKNLKDLLETMQRHGVRGALDVPFDSTYMPHLWIRAWLDRNIADKSVGMVNVKKLLTEAIAKRNGDLEPRHHEAMAESIIKNAGKPHKSQFVSADAFDGVIESMREAGIAPKLIDEVAARLEKRMASQSDRGKLAQLQQTSDAGAARLNRTLNFEGGLGQKVGGEDLHVPSRHELRTSLDKLPADTGNPSNLKFRIQLDESHSITLDSGKTLNVTDLLETNPSLIMRTYSKRALGNSVLAQVMKHSENPNAPIKPVVSLQDLLDRLKLEAEQAGRGDLEAGNIQRIEAGLKHIVGIPIEDLGNPTTQRIARSIQVAKHLLAGKYLSGIPSGIVNATEPISALPAVGVTATFKAFPALTELRQAALDGKLTNSDLALAEYLSGAGADTLLRQVPHRPNGPAALAFDRVLSWLEPKAQSFADFGSVISGMNLGNEFGEKMLGAAQIRRWAGWAESSKGVPEWRSKTTTLAPDMVERILNQIRTHGTKEGDPRTGVKIKDLNWFDWTDNEAASAFRDSIVLESRRMFLRGNANELQRWMGKPLGSLLIQFRGFPFQAMRAKLAYGMATKDVLNGASMLASSAIGAAGYILYTYGEGMTILDPEERKKFLAKRLDPKTIVAASISRASWSSMLTPTVDAAAGVLGFDPVFSPTRSTGIQGKGRLAPITGTPIGDEIDQLTNMVQSFVQPAASSDYSFSQQDLINIGRPILPRALQQIHFMDNIARATGLPKKSKVAQ